MLDLTVPLDPAVECLRQELRAWLAGSVGPGEDASVAQRRAWHKRLHEADWIGVGWPERFGGRAVSALAKYVYYEELARAGVPRLLSTPGIALVGPTLIRHGTAAQQMRYLPRLLSGADVWCLGLSEPDAGSDLASLVTLADRDDDGFLVTGRKTWVRWAAESTHAAILVRTGPEPRHRGLTWLAIDLAQRGITVQPWRSADGTRTFDEVQLDRVRVSAEAVIGESGRGWAIAMELMELERADQSFADHTTLLELLRRAISEAEARDLDPRIRARVQHEAVAIWTYAQLFRAINLRTARRLDRGEVVGNEGSVAKIFWTYAYQRLSAVIDESLGHDILDDGPGGRRYLDARATSIFSGTSEIQRNIIGERIAHLPRH